MRITNINITNYRQYQSLSFVFPESKSNDMHLIIAQNGVGKTNLLNAITWCLYGKEPHLGDSAGNVGLPKLNLTALEDARSGGKDTEAVEVELRAEDEDTYITYKRRVPVRVKPGVFEEVAKERFTVTVATSAGDPKVYEDKDTTSHFVDKYMPEKIREYFYFDGEQLNNYFITGRSKVRDAIFSISQVDVVNLIAKRIGDVITEKQRDAASKSPNIKNHQDALDSMNLTISELEQKIIEHEEQIAKSERIIKENSEYLQGEENLPELEQKFQDLRAVQKSLDDDARGLTQSMFSFVREMKTSLTFYAAAKKTLGLIAQKEAGNELPPSFDRVLLLRALDEQTCPVCKQALSNHSEDFVRRTIESFQISSAASHLLMRIRSELERTVAAAEAYPSKKQNLCEQYQRIENRRKEVERELGEVDRRINRIGQKDEVKRRHTERLNHEEIKRINIEKLGVSKNNVENVRSARRIQNNALEKAITQAAAGERISQLIAFAKKAREIMESIEEEMMNEVRAKMEEQTRRYFIDLIWKKHTYDRIELSQDFQLDLFHKEGYSCVGTCSAAERCLLALSFTLALHVVSGFNSPLFIDTPVARVSDVNRTNFANVLCEVSKNKQIIMTLSPDEYSPEIKRIFEPIVKTNVELRMVDEKITVVK